MILLVKGLYLADKKTRSGTVKCVTPVHAITVSREYFNKYLQASEGALALKMHEKDKARALTRTKMIFRQQNNLMPITVPKGKYLYRLGDEGRQLFILEQGEVDVLVEDHTVFAVKVGDMCGEHPLIMGRPFNASAVCVSDTCKLHVMQPREFHTLLNASPKIKESMQDICLRREFQKAVVFKTKKPFPHDHTALRSVFDAVDVDGSGTISRDEIRAMLRGMDPLVTEEEVAGILSSLAIGGNNEIDFREFVNIFGMSETQEADSSNG